MTKKVTVTLPEELIDRATELARLAGLPFSTWLAGVTQHEVKLQDGLAALREWEDSAGPPSADAQAWADEQFERLESELRPPHRAAS